MAALFAHTYLILCAKLAVGGLLAMAIPPFTRMARGFYTSTGAVYLGAAYLMLAGELYLWLRGPSPVTLPILLTWTAFCLTFSAYYTTLFIELPVLRARLYPAALALGCLALGSIGWGYLPEAAPAWLGLLFAAPMLAGAAISGAAVTGMLLGHWYLIDTGLDLAPFRRMLVFCRRCLLAEVAVVAICALGLWAWPGAPFSEALGSATLDRYGLLGAGRLLAWAAAFGLLVLARRTLAIPQTMAATGLFYVEALTVTVGQILGQWLLFRTGLPL